MVSKRHRPYVNIVKRSNVTDHIKHLNRLYIMIPTMTKQWKVTRTDKGFDGLEFEEAPILKPTENEVLVKFHAVSLNYRDLMIPRAVLYLLTDADRSPLANSMSRENILFLSNCRSSLALMAPAKL